MRILSLTIKDHELLKAFIRRAFPGYRKHKADVTIGQGAVVLSGGYWDDGSRSEWRLVELHGTFVTKALLYPTAPPQFGGTAPPSQPIQGRNIVAETGTFRGKPSTLHLYMSEEAAQILGISHLTPT